MGYFVKIIDGDSEVRLNVEIVTQRSNCAVQELFWTTFFGCHLLEQDISSTRAETRMRNKIKHQHSVNKPTDVLDNGKLSTKISKLHTIGRRKSRVILQSYRKRVNAK